MPVTHTVIRLSTLRWALIALSAAIMGFLWLIIADLIGGGGLWVSVLAGVVVGLLVAGIGRRLYDR